MYSTRKEQTTMTNTNFEELRKSMNGTDTKEVTELLEILDESSKLLAKTYLSALADKQQLEKSNLVATAV